MVKSAPTLLVLTTAFLISCSQNTIDEPAPRANTDSVSAVALIDVPESVKKVVKAQRADFQMTEVLKKIRDGRVYYDVEGVLPGDVEIEFDVLMTSNGPQVVEIQRDVLWTDMPKAVQMVAKDANTENLEVVRIIESIQTDKSIIFEMFVAGQKDAPKYEVQLKDGAVKLLPERWKH